LGAVALSIGASGCGENVQATPQVVIDAQIGPGKHSNAECPQSASPWFQIGYIGNPGLGRVDPNDPNSALKDPPQPAKDGAEEQQGTAAVSCSVIAAGDGFDLALHAELSGATGGAITITGHILRAVDSPGLSAAIARKGEAYSANGTCVATFDTALGQGVASGRVWARLDCPDAAAPSLQRVCATHAEFRFENCAQ
jgi:hypothetical protein